jgi:Tol biopolymer transport system component
MGRGLAVGVFLGAAAAADPTSAQQVRLVSRAVSGSSATPTGGHSWLGETYAYQRSPTGRTLSADGRFVAFTSEAKNLVPGQVDAGHLPNVFRYDRVTNTMWMISHAAGAASTPANQGGSHAFISADGCLVAFESSSTNLLPGPVGPIGPTPQVYLYDCSTDTKVLVSHASSAPTTPGDGNSSLVDLSADGTVVLFGSVATDLIAGGSLQGTNLFAYDRGSATTRLVSHAHNSSTVSADASAFEGRISADGRFVIFSSLATNLVTGFVPVAGNPYNVFVQDRTSGATALVSRQSGTTTTSGNRESTGGSASADGRWIAYNSEASNLVAGQVDANPGSSDLFLFDNQTGTTTLVSHVAGSPLVAADEGSYYAAIGSEGRYVAFGSSASTLVPGFVDGNGAMEYDIFLFDRLAGTNTLVSHLPASLTTSGNLGANAPIVGNDGRVAFQSFATDLAPQPGSFSNQAFLLSVLPARYEWPVTRAAPRSPEGRAASTVRWP